MMKQIIISFLSSLLLTSISMSAQESLEWRHSVELKLSYGGDYNLNYLDASLMPGIHFGVAYPTSEKDQFGFNSGIEIKPQQTFLPVYIDYQRRFSKIKWSLDFGYAFGIWTGIEIKDEHDFRGGLMLGTAFGKCLFTFNGHEFFGQIGYDYRNSELELNPNGSSGAILSTEYNHHFLTLSFEWIL